MKDYTLYPVQQCIHDHFEALARGVPKSSHTNAPSVVFVLHNRINKNNSVKQKEVLTWAIGESLRDFSVRLRAMVIRGRRTGLEEGFFAIQDGVLDIFAIGGYPIDEWARCTSDLIAYFVKVGQSGFLTPKRNDNELLADGKSEAGEAVEKSTTSQETG